MKPRRPKPDKFSGTALLLPEEFEALVACVEDDIRSVQSAVRMATWSNIVVSGVGLLWWLSGANTYGWSISLLVLGLLLIAFLKARKMRSFGKDAERLGKFVKHTHEITHLRTILDLCSAGGRHGSMWWKVSSEADAALLRLLPLIKPIHAEIFNSQHRSRLRHYLFHHSVSSDRGFWRGDGYCLVVLAALEKIGDKRDLRDVERIMKEPYISEEVRLVARHCVQTITGRIVHEDHKDLLLRPGLKPETGATLLRPTVERADTPPQQLLRAASTDDADTPS